MKLLSRFSLGWRRPVGVAGLLWLQVVLQAEPLSAAAPAGGTVSAWGRNNFGQTAVPRSLTGVTAIAAGYYHSVALRADGTVVVWGRRTEGQTAVPAGLEGVAAISAGEFHVVALKRDGTVAVWGAGKTDTGKFPHYGQSMVPPGLGGVTAVAAGWFHSLALKGDGTVVGWGADRSGQATPPADLADVVAIAAGGFHSLALKRDGTVHAWGYATSGQTAVPAGLGRVQAITAGQSHTVVLKADGTVAAWGSNKFGTVTGKPTPETPINAVADPVTLGGQVLRDIVAVSAHGHHTAALRSDGTVVAWGSGTTTAGANRFSQPEWGQSIIPPDLRGVAAIAAGGEHTVVLRGPVPQPSGRPAR